MRDQSTDDNTQDLGIDRVLIVSANPKLMELIEVMMGPYGFETLRAFDNYAALRLCEQQSEFRAIFIDADLPHKTANELCFQLRKVGAQLETPVIQLVSDLRAETIAAAFRSGIQDYVNKSLLHQELHPRLQAHITLREQSRRLRKISEELQLEMYAKADMVRDLAHRGNNPLQAGMAAFANLSHELKGLLHMVEAMVQESEEDAEALTVRQTLERVKKNLQRDQDYVYRNFDRISRAIAEIRLLSGVDGYDQMALDVRACFQEARDRLVEHMGKVGAGRLFLHVKESDQAWRIEAHPTVLAIALERIFYQSLRDYDGDVHIHLEVSSGGRDIRFLCRVRSQGIADFSAECKALIRNTDHMLKPFGLMLRVGQQPHVLILEYSDQHYAIEAA